jgi:transcriptional regulator with XRE-family HTH domain
MVLSRRRPKGGSELRLDRLKEWRSYRGLTQEELAEQANVARYSISNYEKGKTSARRDTAKRIARALDVELEDLMTPPEPSRRLEKV